MRMLNDAMDLLGMAFRVYDPANESMHQVVLSLMTGARKIVQNSDEESRQCSTSLIRGLAHLFSRDARDSPGIGVEPHRKRWDEIIHAAFSVVGSFFDHGVWRTSGRDFDTIIKSTQTLKSTIPYVETLGRRHKSSHLCTPGRSFPDFLGKLKRTPVIRDTEVALELRKAVSALPPSILPLTEEMRVWVGRES